MRSMCVTDTAVSVNVLNQWRPTAYDVIAVSLVTTCTRMTAALAVTGAQKIETFPVDRATMASICVLNFTQQPTIVITWTDIAGSNTIYYTHGGF